MWNGLVGVESGELMHFKLGRIRGAHAFQTWQNPGSSCISNLAESGELMHFKLGRIRGAHAFRVLRDPEAGIFRTWKNGIDLVISEGLMRIQLQEGDANPGD